MVPKLKDLPADLAPRRRTRPRLMRGYETGIESPALRLQQDVAQAMSETRPQKWSARQTLAFAAVSNGAFWLAAFLGAKALLG